MVLFQAPPKGAVDGYPHLGLFTSRADPSGTLLVLGSFINLTERSGLFTIELKTERAFFERKFSERAPSENRAENNMDDHKIGMFPSMFSLRATTKVEMSDDNTNIEIPVSKNEA